MTPPPALAERHCEPTPGAGRRPDSGITGGATSGCRCRPRSRGDSRGSCQNGRTAGLLGDDNEAAATRTIGVAVWNDVRNVAGCPAIDAHRQALLGWSTASEARTAIRRQREKDLDASLERRAAGPVLERALLRCFGASRPGVEVETSRAPAPRRERLGSKVFGLRSVERRLVMLGGEGAILASQPTWLL